MSFVQKGTALANPSQATSGTVSIGGVTAHNLLICTADHGSTSNPPGINTPSGWALAQLGPAVTVTGYTLQTAIYYIMDAPAGTATANLSTSNQSSFYAVISEYSGYALTAALNQLGLASSTGTTSLTGTASSGTPQTTELYIVATAIDDTTGVSNNGSAAPSGYTSLLSKANTQTDDGCQHAYREVTSAATQSATQTATVSSFMSMALASFKAASGGGSTTNIAPSKGAIALAGHAPGILETLGPSVGHAVLAGHAPGILETLGPATGHLVLTGHAPSVQLQQNVIPSVGHLLLAAHTPGLSSSIGPSTGHIVFTGHAPTPTPTSAPVDWLQRARHRRRR